MFFIGQKVVCIEDFYSDGCIDTKGIELPKKGQIFTIRGIRTVLDKLSLLFKEYHFTPVFCEDVKEVRERGFMAIYFRPLIEKKTDISIFTKLLIPSKKKMKKVHDAYAPEDA